MKTLSRHRSAEYSDHLHLDILLRLQHPRTPPEDRWTHGDEHFFIVVHQCGELLLRQVLIDLESATEALSPSSSADDMRRCVDSLRRCAESMKALTASMSALQSVKLSSFISFRPRLGEAGTGQSAQFRKLRSVLGLTGEGHGALFAAFHELVVDNGCDLDQVFLKLGPDHILRHVAEAMLSVAESVWQCQTQRVRLAAWMLGDSVATQDGGEHVDKRATAPFRPLWQARSAMLAEGA